MVKRFMLWLIIVTGAATALYVAWYNRMVDDDLIMAAAVKRAGVLGATIEQYHSWNTRWMSFLHLHTWMWFLNAGSSLLLYHFTTFAALVLAFWRLVRTAPVNECLRPEMRTNSLLTAGLLAIALLICTFDIADTWYWMNTSTMYGWNLIALLLALGLVLQPLQRNYLQDGILTFLGLYYGGASEPATGIYFLAITGLYYFHRELLRVHQRHIINFSIGVTVGFIIAWFGTGHAKRDAALPDPDALALLTKGAYFTAKIALYHLPLRLLLALPLLMSIWQPGILYKGNSLLQTTIRTKLIGITLLSAHTYFMVWIMGDYGPARAWSHISLLMIVLASIWILTTNLQLRPMLLNATLMIVVATLLYTGYRQIVLVPTYRNYLDNLQSSNIEFDPKNIPESGLMHKVTMGKIE